MTTTTLMQAHNEWANRPDDQRFLSLLDLQAQMKQWKDEARGMVISSRQIEVAAVAGEEQGLVLAIDPRTHRQTAQATEIIANPTNWSFGQLCSVAGAPAGFLRTLPGELAALNLNYKLRTRAVEDVGLLVRQNGTTTAAAVTGPGYGRVWNLDVVNALVKRFGDGVTGDFRIPGEFGKRVTITKGNTTIYASDRDMFVFLADEDHRIEMPNRRNGQPGTMARGFFVWNSEVGAATLGIKAFLHDYTCANRIVWGVEDVKEIRIRHTAKAPDRFVEEVTPALKAYAESSTTSLLDALKAAQHKRLASGTKEERKEKVQEFLKTRKFTASQISGAMQSHEEEEGKPIETVWDAVTGLTAYARTIKFQDERVDLETKAGSLMNLTA